MANNAEAAVARRPGDLTVSGGVNAADNARLHIGNINNHETLRSDRRNEELLRAAAEGQTPRVRHLLDLEADFDYRDEVDLTALHHAVFSGFEDVVSLLIHRGADVNSPSLNVGTPLILAILKQRSNVVQLLLSARGIDVDAVVESLGSAMHCAAWCANIDIARMLIGHGTVNDRERRLRCEADIVVPAVNAVYSWSGRRAQFLADESHGHWLDATPILLAVLAANCAVVELMHLQDMSMDRMWWYKLRSRSITNTRVVGASEGGWEASRYDLVSIACDRPDDAILGFLILHGATSNRVYDNGTTLLMRAARGGDAECLKVLLTTVDQAEIDRRGPDGRTALSYAAEHGREGCVSVLNTHGALNTIVDISGDTPLHRASAKGQSNTAQLLIDSGAEVDCVNRRGLTALHLAFREQHLATVLCLVNAGAECSLQTKDGTSLLHMLLKHHERDGYTGFVKDFTPWPLQAMSLDQETLRKTGTNEPNVLEQVLASAKAGDNHSTKRFNYRRREAFVLYSASTMQTAPHLLGLLRALGGVVNITEDGLTCIQIAAEAGNAAATQDLLAFQRSSGAPPNVHMPSILNACLKVAVYRQHAEVVNVVLRHGADPNCRTNQGSTIMQFAISSVSSEVVELLRRAGGDVPMQNDAGRSPSSIAIAHNEESHTNLKNGTSGPARRASRVTSDSLLLRNIEQDQSVIHANSDSVASPLWDTETGSEIDGISSEDIVALIDHLTVRDHQRNARDTEILVNLVRSAAEMRGTFQDFVRFINDQDKWTLHAPGSRSGQPMSQNKANQPLAPIDRSDDNLPVRKSRLSRSLEALARNKSASELAVIEKMLTEILNDVESLKMKESVIRRDKADSVKEGHTGGFQMATSIEHYDPAKEEQTTSPAQFNIGERPNWMPAADRVHSGSVNPGRDLTRSAIGPRQKPDHLTRSPMTYGREDILISPSSGKGLFSLSTTSSLPVRAIDAEIKRVLTDLDVDHHNIKGGLACSLEQEICSRKFEKTHVCPDMCKTSARLSFELHLVKVPFLDLHGIRFKLIEGGTWRYRTTTESILFNLHL